MVSVKLKIEDIEPNTGQVEGLPINPRQWTKKNIETIAASLKETPELFAARPIIVYPYEGKYVIMGGNLRYEGAKFNKEAEVPCVVLSKDTPIEKLKEIVIKDNGSFGSWDYEILSNAWGDEPLADWGINWVDSSLINDDDVDAAFENAAKADDQTHKIVVSVPYNYFDNEEDIIAAVRVTVEEWPGVTVK